MSPSKLDKLLRQVASLEDSTGEMPRDETLRAYRAGRLSDAEAQAVEKQLSRNPGARRRLIELADLEALDESRALAAGSGGEKPNAPLTRIRRQRWALAASVVGILLLGLWFGVISRQLPRPMSSDYEVLAFGLATARGETVPPGSLEARPETALRFEIAPREEASADVEFGLYGRDGDALRRFQRVDARQLEASQGAAVLRLRASEILTEGPGDYLLFVVVARPGDLPVLLELEPGETGRDRLAEGSRRKVYPQTVRLLAGC
ncbi:MAG: hypothetical protein AAF604_02470 [Acidobacteriota bacterium]